MCSANDDNSGNTTTWHYYYMINWSLKIPALIYSNYHIFIYKAVIHKFADELCNVFNFSLLMLTSQKHINLPCWDALSVQRTLKMPHHFTNIPCSITELFSLIVISSWSAGALFVRISLVHLLNCICLVMKLKASQRAIFSGNINWICSSYSEITLKHY